MAGNVKATSLPKPKTDGKNGEPGFLSFATPSTVTVMALVSGLTAMIMAHAGRLDAAVACVLLAALLDAFDGLVARRMNGESRFGAELDSLADSVNFGAVPCFILYVWGQAHWGLTGWLFCLAPAVACALRLARFNAALDEPDRTQWKQNYFTGVPAPAGALLALVPVYLHHLGLVSASEHAALVMLWALGIAVLMVSRLPTFSAKPVLAMLTRWPAMWLAGLGAVLAAGFAAAPWAALSLALAAYAVSLPVSAWCYQRRLTAQD